MAKEKGTSTARFLSRFFIPITFFIGQVLADDLFEGNIFPSDCIKGIPMTGCSNETLFDAYNKTELPKGDKNINKAETHAYLFTPCNKQKAEFLHKCGGMLPQNTNYRPEEKTVIVVGGYVSPPCGVPIFLEIKDQLLCRHEFINVILFEWNWGNGPDYYGAAQNTEIVGKQMAFVMANIMDQTGAQSKNFHIVGHSLGAHIAGCAGEYLQKMGKPKPGRITALDPAGPAFMDVNNSRCNVSKDDAELLDVIHSNAGKCLPFALGIPWNIGHADFFPNGGHKQPACYVNILTSLLKGQLYYALLLTAGPFCPHFGSVHYFKESINPCECQFVGRKCTEQQYKDGMCNSCGADGSLCAVMGYDWEYCQPKLGNHSYYLTTKLVCPTCNNAGIDLGGFSTTPPKCGDKINCFEPGKCPVHNC